jgi:hypothetical protein
MADDPYREILRRVGELDRDMLERRKALNAEHYLPRLAPIQADCAALGHVQGRHILAVTASYFVCGYCGAVMKETREEYGSPRRPHSEFQNET